jgi:hypothetical protein
LSESPKLATAESSAAAVVEALDGCERKLLLTHLARTSPTVVDAGIMWLGEYHAASRERRRTIHNRKSKDRRRRLRAAAATNG